MSKRTVSVLCALLVCLGAGAKGKAVIGVTPSMISGRFGVTDGYTIAITKAGGLPTILPIVRTREDALEVMSRMDGLMVVGGEDVDPRQYGEEKLFDNVQPLPLRDTIEILYVKAAQELGKPVLGICRGSQLINAMLGGTLYQDIPSQVPGSNHRQPYTLWKTYHKIGIEKGSFLDEIYHCDSLFVNSGHHQAVKDLAPSLRVAARAEDGIVEAYEGKGIIAMQFHPEALVYAGDDSFLPIFEKFINLCSSRKRR